MKVKVAERMPVGEGVGVRVELGPEVNDGKAVRVKVFVAAGGFWFCGTAGEELLLQLD